MVTAGVIKLGTLWYDSSGNESCSFNNEEFSNDVWSFNVLVKILILYYIERKRDNILYSCVYIKFI